MNMSSMTTRIEKSEAIDGSMKVPHNNERGFDKNIRKCRSTNQQLLAKGFCENWNSFVY